MAVALSIENMRIGSKKGTKFNRTSQTHFAPHLLANPISIVKTMTDSTFRLFPG
ncbi:hypothetical protein NTG1052_390004 [Candidatus Nitrotoga sp. 1052]|nr:hypothetical protein NTG1052_390004 [Candidatus Nitrotoga sp. 1052]